MTETELEAGMEAKSGVEVESKASAESVPMVAPPVGSSGGRRQEVVRVGSEAVMLARSLDEMSSSVSAMAAGVRDVAVSLGVVRARVEEQGRLVDESYRRVCAVEAATTTSRAWQCEAEAAIKSILEKVGGGGDV